MKIAHIYIWVSLGIILFLGLFGLFLAAAYFGFGGRAYVEATRYMSIGGKITGFLLTVGMFIFLFKFTFALHSK